MSIKAQTIALLIIAIAQIAVAGDQTSGWREFRGPLGNGIVEVQVCPSILVTVRCGNGKLKLKEWVGPHPSPTIKESG